MKKLDDLEKEAKVMRANAVYDGWQILRLIKTIRGQHKEMGDHMDRNCTNPQKFDSGIKAIYLQTEKEWGTCNVDVNSGGDV